MEPLLEQGSIDKPLTFDLALIQLSFIPVCSPNTCNISVMSAYTDKVQNGKVQVKFRGGFAFPYYYNYRWCAYDALNI